LSVSAHSTSLTQFAHSTPWCRINTLLSSDVELVIDDVVAGLHTLVADRYFRPGDELADLALGLVAERASQNVVDLLPLAAIIALRRSPGNQEFRAAPRLL